MEPKRRLLEIHVNFISLVAAGANRKVILWKAAHPSTDDSEFTRFIKIAKIDEDQRLVYGIVYAPDEVDTDGDTATAEVIKAAAYEFMEQNQNDHIDKGHDEKADEGFVAESWIVQKGDPTFDEVGAWAVVIKVTDDTTWNEIKRGDIKGLSLGGRALAQDLNKGDDIMKTDSIVAAVKKAWYEMKVSGELPGGSDDVPSVQEQMAGIFKDNPIFAGAKSEEDAKKVLDLVKETVEALQAEAREVLKDRLPGTDPDDKDEDEDEDGDKDKDKDEEDEDGDKDLEKVVKAAFAPVAETLKNIDGRLKAIEDSPLGSFSLDSDGGSEAPVTKDGHRIIQMIKRRS